MLLIGKKILISRKISHLLLVCILSRNFLLACAEQHLGSMRKCPQIKIGFLIVIIEVCCRMIDIHQFLCISTIQKVQCLHLEGIQAFFLLANFDSKVMHRKEKL